MGMASLLMMQPFFVNEVKSHRVVAPYALGDDLTMPKVLPRLSLKITCFRVNFSVIVKNSNCLNLPPHKCHTDSQDLVKVQEGHKLKDLKGFQFCEECCMEQINQKRLSKDDTILWDLASLASLTMIGRIIDKYVNPGNGVIAVDNVAICYTLNQIPR